jgi:hypothetical protein
LSSKDEAPPAGTERGPDRNPSGDEPSQSSFDGARHQPNGGKSRRTRGDVDGQLQLDLWTSIRPNVRRAELRKLRELRNGLGQPDIITDLMTSPLAVELDGAELGRFLDFRFSEYKLFGQRYRRHPSTIRPIDANQCDIEEYLREWQRPRKAAARRKRRAEARERRAQAADLDCKASAILTVLPRDGWLSIKQLMKVLARSSAFRIPNGKRFLTGNSLRQAILRELKKRPLIDKLERKPATEKHGMPMILVRRR